MGIYDEEKRYFQFSPITDGYIGYYCLFKALDRVVLHPFVNNCIYMDNHACRISMGFGLSSTKNLLFNYYCHLLGNRLFDRVSS